MPDKKEPWQKIHVSAKEEAQEKERLRNKLRLEEESRKRQVYLEEVQKKAAPDRSLKDLFNDLNKIKESAREEQEQREKIRRTIEKVKRDRELDEKIQDKLGDAAKRATQKRDDAREEKKKIDIPLRTDKKLRKVKSIRFKKK